MKVAVFSNKPYTERFFRDVNKDFGHELIFNAERLNEDTVRMAQGADAVCIFVNDICSRPVLNHLKQLGVRLVALRCAGFNNVDVKAAEDLGICVVRVPAYSPYAVAEHAIGLILALNRRIHLAHLRMREGNFSLEGLLGFDLHGKSVGVIGTGKIGEIVCRILHGFGCQIYAFDPQVNPACEAMGIQYTGLDEIYKSCDIITLHCPLMPQTHHMIDSSAIEKMRHGVMLINTSRGALIDTRAVIDGLKSGQIGYLGLDVYEEEGDLFFEDLSNQIIQDDVFARLLMFPNVIVTGHQAFFTYEAMHSIAKTTLSNISSYDKNQCQNIVTCSKIHKG